MGKREQNRADLRARILEAARELFTLHGADDVTIAVVAAHAGVARATVFNQFGSKHALMHGVTEQVWANYTLRLDQALADRTTPTPFLIRGLFVSIGQEIEGSRHFYRSVFREMFKLSLGLDKRGSAQQSRQAAKDRLFQLIARGQNRGDLSCDHQPEDLITAMGSLIDGTISLWLYDDCSEPLSERMVRTADIFLNSVSTADTPAFVDQCAATPAPPFAIPSFEKAISGKS